MSVNGKRDSFTLDDFVQCAKNASLKRDRYKAILTEVQDVVAHRPEFAKKAEVPEKRIEIINDAQRRDFPAK